MRANRVSAAALAAALAFCISPSPTFAQIPSGGGEPIVPEKVGKEFHAYRLSGQPPRIDGRLDDEAWTLAETIDERDLRATFAAPGTNVLIVKFNYWLGL
jgi:hypothetical protein